MSHLGHQFVLASQTHRRDRPSSDRADILVQPGPGAPGAVPSGCGSLNGSNGREGNQEEGDAGQMSATRAVSISHSHSAERTAGNRSSSDPLSLPVATARIPRDDAVDESALTFRGTWASCTGGFCARA